MTTLDHLHPLAVAEQIDLGDGSQETVLNSWGTASLFTETLEDQGPNGQAAGVITASLADAGHPVIRTTELISQVLAGDSQSQARLRVLQQQLAEAIQTEMEKALDQEGAL